MLGYSGNLEEVAVAALRPFDPVLCLGHSPWQSLGALRFDAFDHDWQVSANRLLHSATRLLLMASWTEGLAWEVREVFSQRLQGRLILLVPPRPPFRRPRWNESISNTPIAAIPTAQLKSAIALRFGENGKPIPLVSTSRTALAYGVALRVACLPAMELERLSAPFALA